MTINFYKILSVLFLFFYSSVSAQPDDFKMLSANRISGLIPDIEDGYGVSFRDFNKDGYPDVYLVCFRNLNRFLVNNGGIVPFIDRTIYSGLGGNLMPRMQANLELGSSAGDFDNDGRPDIFLGGWGKSHSLFRNTGSFNFQDVSENLNLQSPLDANFGLWLDVNNDGWLDLYITDEHHANRLLINQKNGAFNEMPWSEGFRDSAVSQGACGADFDGDGDTDIYVSNWFAPDYLLLNNGYGHFEKAALELTPLKHAISTNSASAGDVDNDGDLDLFIAGRDGELYCCENVSEGGRAAFVEKDIIRLPDSSQRIYGILLEDFNHDGWLDCFLSVKGPNRLHLNDGMGNFSAEFDTDGNNNYSTGCAAADLDRDGDLDIFAANKDALSQIFLNPVNDNNYIKLKLKGIKSVREAIGSKVYFYNTQTSPRRLIGFREVRSASGYLSSTDPIVHFGTGEYEEIDVKIVFQSGRIVERNGLLPGREYTVREYRALLGSLYSFSRGISFLARQKSFWINAGLALLLSALIYLFSRLIIRRYRWSAVEMTTFYVLWFIITVIILLAFRNFSAFLNLLAVNGTALAGIFTASVFSEYNLRLRRKRMLFRSALQNFSEKMITIHGNKELFEKLQQTFLKHEEIADVKVLQYNDEDKLLVDSAEEDISCPLDDESLQIIRQNNLCTDYSTPELRPVFQFFKSNLLIPVWRGEKLFGLIAVWQDNVKSPLNQEDVRLLLPIANQLAIAIENNIYIDESAKLIKQLTEAEVREEYLKQLEESNRQLDEKNAELTRLFRELQDKESQLVHSEKMASLGQLVAGISHELNNPVSFIYANSKALERYLDKIKDLWTQSRADESMQESFDKVLSDLKNIINDNLQGSKNVKDLVLDLKNFSRLDQADWKEAHLVKGIESSLKILKSQIPKTVVINKDFKADPLISCNPGQINQVFVNLISNALQAVDEDGIINLSSVEEDDFLVIKVEDNGKGIPRKNLSKIFEPFFTTKDVNKGTGLGLSISYSIIQKHGGSLTAESKEGQGSIFTIKLPTQNKLLSMSSL